MRKISTREFIEISKHLLNMNFSLLDHNDDQIYTFEELKQDLDNYIKIQLQSANADVILEAYRHPFIQFFKSFFT